ncbi:MAG: extracellular solute-binding protein [Hyphomicrobiales bacterium]
MARISSGDVIALLSEGTTGRREFLKLVAAAGLGLATWPLGARSAAAEGELAILSWSGYDIPEMAPEFYKAHGKPAFTLMGSDEEGFQKVAAGFKPDLAHHTSFMVGKLRDAGLIQPIDVSRLKHWSDFFPELRDIEVVDGKVWIAPCSWGNSSVIYRADLVKPTEESWGVLWDEQLKGKIAARDAVEGLLITAGLYGGAKDPWNMTDDELAKAKDLLLKQKPLVKFYWSSQTDLEQSLASGEVAAAYGWNASVALLRKQGVDMAMMRPKEGIVTWTDGLVMYKDHPGSEDLAYEFINAYMTPEVGKFLIESYGYGSGNEKAYPLVKPERLKELGIEEPAKILATSRFQKQINPDVRQKYQAIFDEVKFAG